MTRLDGCKMAEEQVSQSGAATDAASRRHRSTRVGVVTSDVRDKSIRVEYSYSVRHAKYGKGVRRTTTLHAHDERNEASVGDRVEVIECRPYSKTKHWRLLRVVEKLAKGGAS